jgi:MYXO-CTERM domain-containing protein
MAEQTGARLVALSELKASFGRLDRKLLLAESLFVVGWSLMWASSLHLVPFLDAWLAMLVLGLLLGWQQQRRKKRSSGADVK